MGSNDISLDGRPLTEASKVAFNLGQSVYPLSFQMNEEDYELLNFDAAKAQWDKYSKRQFNIEVQFVKSVNYTFEQSL